MMAPRAHSSMAEQPAHNRLDLGSSPGGPTVVAGAASPAYSVGGLRRGAVWLRPARHFSFHRAASPAYSVGGLSQLRVAPHPQTTRAVARRVAPVRGQSEGVWIHSSLR